MPHSTRHDRRRFLQGLGALIATGATGALLPQLALMRNAVAAAPGPGEYRALVCIFLYGGNDSYNMLIPYVQSEYDVYEASRGGVYDAVNNPFGLGVDRSTLTQITDTGGKKWGLNPSFAAVKPLFNAGELAFLANVGPLVEPISNVNGDAGKPGGPPVPPYLFSHNDQQRQWMRGHSTSTNTAYGWGGMCGDQLSALNAGLAGLPPTLSLSGANHYQAGELVLPYAISSSGPSELQRMKANSTASDLIRRSALEDLLNANYSQKMRLRYAGLGSNSLAVNAALLEALDPGNGGDIATVFPADGLSAQLRMIARLIKVSAGTSIGHTRQIYFASMGGFDTHDAQMQDGLHGALLAQLAGAMAAFREGLNEIGMLNNVTSFTMSDFGRTLNSNGNGTDHAWGGVQMVMGGAAANGGSLNGKQVWGTYPVLELEGDMSMGRGRMIPTTSIQQLGATLGSWMGVDSSALDTIFPGRENFPTAPLGFLAEVGSAPAVDPVAQLVRGVRRGIGVTVAQ